MSSSLRSALSSTFTAFAVGFSRQCKFVGIITPVQNCKTYNRASSTIVLHQSTIRTLSSTFEAPEPPKSKGQSIYDDITISNSVTSSQASVRNNDIDAVFVVNGASRGIGLQFVKSLMDRTKGNVFACCRSPEKATALNEFISTLTLEEDVERLKVLELDVEKQSSIEAAAVKIKTISSRIDVLLNVAGILGDGGEMTPGPERSIKKIDRDWAEKTMSVNVIGPLMLTKELSPLMAQRRRRGGGGKDESDRRPPSIVANLSARVGSISDNELGGWYSYRISKAALNQATRTMAHELKRQSTWCIALHPGTTNTDLSKPFQGNVQKGRLFPVDFTVGCLLDIIDSMEEKNSGGLYDWAGKALPF